MPHHRMGAFAAAMLSLVLLASSAAAQVIITQKKANDGNITPGDTAGFPITITQPGSYVLKSNLQPPKRKNGIVIASHDVTIDFNGYRLHGFGVANQGVLTAGDGYDTVLLENGVIAGFKGAAVTGRNFWTIQDMRILVNGGTGIDLKDSARIQRNTISYNGDLGVSCSDSCLVEDNVVDHTQYSGVYVKTGTVIGNSLFYNGVYGLIADLDGFAGFGNNTLFGNKVQVGGNLIALQPNACSPAC